MDDIPPLFVLAELVDRSLADGEPLVHAIYNEDIEGHYPSPIAVDLVDATRTRGSCGAVMGIVNVVLKLDVAFVFVKVRKGVLNGCACRLRLACFFIALRCSTGK